MTECMILNAPLEASGHVVSSNQGGQCSSFPARFTSRSRFMTARPFILGGHVLLCSDTDDGLNILNFGLKPPNTTSGDMEESAARYVYIVKWEVTGKHWNVPRDGFVKILLAQLCAHYRMLPWPALIPVFIANWKP